MTPMILIPEVRRRWPRQLALWCSLILWVVLMVGLLLYILSSPARAEEGWERYLHRACDRYKCDDVSRRLMLAIAVHEPDWRENQSIGDDLRSFGRYQIHIKTAIRLKYGRGYERRILLYEYANLIFLLGDEAYSADLAVSIMTACQFRLVKPRNRARCYHGSASEASHIKYLAHIMPIYERFKKAEITVK